MTVFWVVWDGAPEWIVRSLADSGDLPVLARLRREGIHAGLPATAPNCQTPTGLATLFTGTEPPEHGVTGFWVPGGPSGLKGQRRAFDPGVLRRPPVWDLVPGLRAVFLHAPWARATSGSQFFITVGATPWLNGKHTIFGQVIDGADVVDKISRAQTVPGDRPTPDVVIQSVTIQRD